MPAHLVAEGSERPGFPWLPATLDELHDRHPLAVAKGSQHEAQSRCGLAFAMAGEHQDQPLLPVAFLHALALNGLSPFHPSAIPGVILFRREIASHTQFGRLLVEIAVAHGEGA